MAYSGDLRERVIEARASRREAAECFEVSVASAVKWLQRRHQTRSATPKPRGGSISAPAEFAAEILALIAEQPDLTLVETVAELRKRRIRTIQLALAFSPPTQHHPEKKLQSAERKNLARLRGRAPRGVRVIGIVSLGTCGRRSPSWRPCATIK
jgi:hypothetical protein